MECSAEGGRKWFGETAIVLFIVVHSCGGCKSWHCEVPQDMSMMAPANRKNHPVYFRFNRWNGLMGKEKGHEIKKVEKVEKVTKTMAPDWV